MSGQKLSFKDKLTSHLPGHKNQDRNANGIPDRLEKNQPGMMNQGGVIPTGNGAFIPGSSQTTTTTQVMGNAVAGRPYRDNIIQDEIITSQTINREPVLVQTMPMQQTMQPMTDFNRNGIPDQLEGQGFGFVGSVPAIRQSTVDVRQAPVIVEQIQKPAVVHEVYKTEEVVQIQPVIERERDQLDVYEVIQPMREREVIATEIREAVLPAQTRGVVVQDNSAFLAARSVPGDFSTRDVVATRSQVVENAPIVHETIVHRVVEEVQPVIYKEVDRPVLIKETLPIYEKIVEVPHAHHTVLPMRDLGVRSVQTGIIQQTGYTTTGMQSGLQSQGTFVSSSGMGTSLNDLNRNGIPDQMERQGSLGMAQPMIGQPTVGFANQGMMQGGLNDRNMNGIPDNLEGGYGRRTLGDLNGNGIPDRQERMHGLKDLNGNGIDDSLERRIGGTLNQNRRM